MTVSKASHHVYRQLPGRRSADPLPASTESSSIRIVEVGPGQARTAHRHPLSEEVIYVESGRGVVWIDGERERVEPGDVILVPTGAAHGTVPVGGSTMRLICFFPHADLGQNMEETETAIPSEREPN